MEVDKKKAEIGMHGMHIRHFLLGSVKNNPVKEGVITSLNPITKNDTCMMMMHNMNKFF